MEAVPPERNKRNLFCGRTCYDRSCDQNWPLDRESKNEAWHYHVGRDACGLGGRATDVGSRGRAGPAAQLAFSERIPFQRRMFLDLETKLTGAWARVPIACGTADVPNLAAHGLIGIGFRF